MDLEATRVMEIIRLIPLQCNVVQMLTELLYILVQKQVLIPEKLVVEELHSLTVQQHHSHDVTEQVLEQVFQLLPIQIFGKQVMHVRFKQIQYVEME